jgi:hypothetical protein
LASGAPPSTGGSALFDAPFPQAATASKSIA